ncbi:MAG: 30S ribosomal protein S20 [Spirochaetaceae bacterium]|nr:30S ribosomal protein S20 [Spirochaetaceae bacterium]
MPNSRDSAKRDRKAKAVRLVNRSAKSAVRTIVKKVEKQIAAGDKANATEDVKKMVKALDTAARKGLFSKNAVARKKSRLQKKINKLV